MKPALAAGVTGLAMMLAGAPAQAQQPEQVIAFLDKNHDGNVNLDEYLAYQQPRIAQFDKDSDGELSLAEFKESLQGKAKKNAPGLFKGANAERRFHETDTFEFANTGGYYHSLPGDPLREFIDTAAEVQRAMGFENEKDHPEVAPSQFEMNYSYGDVVSAADNIQLYKLICRQVAHKLGHTASFLPKPVVGVNGNGMHTNVSITKGGKNIFWDASGEEKLSKFAWEFVDRILTHGNDICLMLNSSVNAYRRLDPHFEAPNQIKASPTDRGSMVRIPIGNEKSARVEVRSVAPDSNPYMVMLAVFQSGLDGSISSEDGLRQAKRFLPDNIYDAIANFRSAPWTAELLGEDVKGRYADLKQASADRCARLLGTFVKAPEVQFHHEVYNQYLWNQF